MKDTISHYNATLIYYSGNKVLYDGQEIIIENEGIQTREALLKISVKQLKHQRDSLVNLLKELLNDEDISFYPSAIEGGTKQKIDFDKWEIKARALVSKIEE